MPWENKELYDSTATSYCSGLELNLQGMFTLILHFGSYHLTVTESASFFLAGKLSTFWFWLIVCLAETLRSSMN